MRTFLNLNITIATSILLASCTKDTLAPRVQDDPAQAPADVVASATALLEDDATPTSSTASATPLLETDTPRPSTIVQGTPLLEDDATGESDVRPDVVYYLAPNDPSISRIITDGFTPLEPVLDESPSSHDTAPF